MAVRVWKRKVTPSTRYAGEIQFSDSGAVGYEDSDWEPSEEEFGALSDDDDGGLGGDFFT